MRYMIIDFEEREVTLKDTLKLDPSCVDEGGSEKYEQNDDGFWLDIMFAVEEQRGGQNE